MCIFNASIAFYSISSKYVVVVVVVVVIVVAVVAVVVIVVTHSKNLTIGLL